MSSTEWTVRPRMRLGIVGLGVAVGLLVGAAPAMSDPLDPYDHLIGCGFDQEDGTSGDDKLIGSETTRDTLRGFAGNDVIKGFGCGDTLQGGGNIDNIYGAHGNDVIDLGDGHDGLNLDGNLSGGARGGAGHDNMNGGLGGDVLLDDQDGPLDVDRLFGDDGNDFLRVDDGDTSDTASGGSGGSDTCVSDSQQETGTDCETRII